MYASVRFSNKFITKYTNRSGANIDDTSDNFKYKKTLESAKFFEDGNNFPNFYDRNRAGDGNFSGRKGTYDCLPTDGLFFHRFIKDSDQRIYIGFVKWNEEKLTFEKNGKGALYWHDQRRFYDGYWVNDQMEGEGIFYWRNGTIMYKGFIKENMYEGYGKKYHQSGKLQQAGIWRKGKCIKEIVIPKKSTEAEFLDSSVLPFNNTY